MPVYITTKDQRIIRYGEPYDKSAWLQTDYAHSRYYIYYKNCTCSSCENDTHKQLIAYVPFDNVVTIGFIKPIVVEGRLLTAIEKQSLSTIKTWLDKRKAKGTLPRKIHAEVLDLVTK